MRRKLLALAARFALGRTFPFVDPLVVAFLTPLSDVVALPCGFADAGRSIRLLCEDDRRPDQRRACSDAGQRESGELHG